MSTTNRTPRQVIDEVVYFPVATRGGRLTMIQRIEDALHDEAWIRTPEERQRVLGADDNPAAGPVGSRED